MNNQMKYEIEEYLDSTDKAFYALMTASGIPQCSLKVVPKITPERIAGFEDLKVGTIEFNEYFQKNVLPVITRALVVHFNRETKSIETTVICNPLFEKVLFLEEIDENKLDGMEQSIKKHEELFDVEFEDRVPLSINMVGFLKKRT